MPEDVERADHLSGSFDRVPVVSEGEFNVIEKFHEPSDLEERAARERTLARLRLLWRSRRFLARVTACGLALSVLLAFTIPKRYRSTTRLMPPEQQSGMGTAVMAAVAGKGGAGLSTLADNLLGIGNSSDLFVGVLHSQTVQDNLIDKFELRKVYDDRTFEEARKDLEGHTDISQDRKSGIITISVTERDPQRATAMAQQYVTELNRVVNQVSTSSGHRERVFLEGRLAEVKDDLENAEQEFSQFASKNTAIDIKEQGRAMVGAAAVLQGNLIAVQSELEGLRQIYADSNVRVKAAEARISELRAQLKKLGGDDKSPSLDGASTYDSIYPSIRRLPLLGVTYADLYRRTKVDEAVFEVLTQEYELAKVKEAKDIPSVKVLDPADQPEKKTFPPRVLIAFIGTLLSLGSAAAWVLGIAFWNQTDSRDPRKVFVREVLRDTRTSLPWAS